jgi:hypothetical protein
MRALPELLYILKFPYERSGRKGLFERLILGININTLKKSLKRHYKHEEGIVIYNHPHSGKEGESSEGKGSFLSSQEACRLTD